MTKKLNLHEGFEKKLLELGIAYCKKKTDIVADVFGQRIRTIYEGGLIDVPDEESFYVMLESKF